MPEDSLDKFLIFKNRKINNKKKKDRGKLHHSETQIEPMNESDLNIYIPKNEPLNYNEESDSTKHPNGEKTTSYCIWHPWRASYKVCDYCKNPFCYEDIVEYKGKFYCLSDIDRIYEREFDEQQIKSKNLFYNWSETISNFLSLAIFVIMDYSIIELHSLSTYSIFVFLGLALLIIGALLSFSTFRISKSGIYASSIFEVAVILFFIYYLSIRFNLYLISIPVLSLISILLMIKINKNMVIN